MCKKRPSTNGLRGTSDRLHAITLQFDISRFTYISYMLVPFHIKWNPIESIYLVPS